MYVGTQLSGDKLEQVGDRYLRQLAQLGIVHVCIDPPGSAYTWSRDVLRRHIDRVLPIIEADHQSEADVILLDAPTPGSGQALDWATLERPEQTFWLAGGLNVDNVGAAIRAMRPDGVDVSSGVETNGQKDHDKIRAFIRRAKEETQCIHNQ